ncbi:MAG: LPS export ABC transporter ATP-binding protein [Fimbriimonadaceae bacterium]|nr:LPS export ABC transporter ATP-binding protein [Alphaproteobacteria bacterium]
MHVQQEHTQHRLRAANLIKSYGHHAVVMNISIEIGRGEVVALLGPNGAGKTTLLSMITGIIKPDAGYIEIDGFDVTTLPIYARAQLGLSYLPQESSVFRGLSVEDNILLYLETYEPDPKRRHMLLDNILEEFDLTSIRKSNTTKLSGGQRRRCEIARALASDPTYILLDEPFAGIDPLAISYLQDTIRNLRDRGLGVLISDHNVRDTLSIVDRAYIVVAGRILAQGTPDQIAADENVRYYYLGNSLDK